MQTHVVRGSHGGGREGGNAEPPSREPLLARPGAATPPGSFEPGLLESLGRRAAYPHDPSAGSHIEHVQTHISHLFLTRDRVYKLRKPVQLGFVDFTTRSERNADCVREVQLNRRLAPGVYLGVAPLEPGPEGFVVGEIVGTTPSLLPNGAEHCVVMRRLPAGRDALSRLSAGRLTPRHIDAVAERIARFHQGNRLPRQPLGDDPAILERVMQPFRNCILALEGVLPSSKIATQLRVIDRLAHLSLDAGAAHFCARARRQLRVEGHGDLHLQHVWFERDDDSPVLIDCVEFDRELREIDAASDLAFLAMDLAYRGHEELAERLLGRYANATDDFDLFRVIDYFQSYRAMVRAKVAAIASADPALELAKRREAGRSAERHLALAERLLRQRPCGSLIVLCGKVGTGKSTVAEFLADGYGGTLLSSDRLRKRLAGLAPGARVVASKDTGLYSPERRSEIYEAMLERAAPVVASGRLALLDASFNTPEERDRARRWASERGVPVLLIEVECQPSTALERLARRQTMEGNASDAGPDFYATSVARFEPPSEWPRNSRVWIWTDEPTWRVEMRRKLRSWLSRNLREGQAGARSQLVPGESSRLRHGEVHRSQWRNCDATDPMHSRAR